MTPRLDTRSGRMSNRFSNTRTRALVLRTAGINCDGETVRALELSGAAVDLLHLKLILAEPARLGDYSLLVIPGGFSYGDDVAAGRVFGLELRHGLRRELATFVEHGGFVLGVCNGSFQKICRFHFFYCLSDNRANKISGMFVAGDNSFVSGWPLPAADFFTCPAFTVEL